MTATGSPTLVRRRSRCGPFAALVVALGLVAAGCAAPADGGSVSGVTVHTRETLVPAIRAALEETTSVHVEGKVSGPTALTLRADVARDGDEPLARVTVRGLPMTPGPVEVRVVDGSAYLSAAPMTEPGRFVRVPLPKGHAGADPTPDALEPRQWVRRLTAVLRSVRHRGAEEHDGETWQRYEVTLAPRALVRSGAEAGTQLPGRGPGMMPRVLPERLTTDLWLGSDDLVRRVRLDLPAMPGVVGQDTEGPGELRVDFSAWNEPVQVSAPPEAAVQEAPPWMDHGMLEGLLSGRGGSAGRP